MVTYRTALGYTKNFSPRLIASANVFGIYRNTTSNLTDSDFSDTTVEASFGLQYRLTRNLTLNGNYSFTGTRTSTGRGNSRGTGLFLGEITQF